MSVDQLSDDFKSQLNLTPTTVEVTKEFCCAMRGLCLMGDPSKIVAGANKVLYKTWQWHEKCFCCLVCRKPITTPNFVSREQEIFCRGCYEGLSAPRCVKCHQIMTQGGYTSNGHHWHGECFTCTSCNTSLVGQRFNFKDEKPYCGQCLAAAVINRCVACMMPVIGISGVRVVTFVNQTSSWHMECFKCSYCWTPLLGQNFKTIGPHVFCAHSCNGATFAP